MVSMPLPIGSPSQPIPEGWQTLQLGDLFAFQNGMNADKSAYGHGLPFINVLEVISRSHIDVLDIPGRVFVPANLIETYKVRNGDVLFNRTSETQEEVGLAATFLGNDDVVFGGFVIRGRPRGKRLHPVFSSYALRSSPVRTQIVSRGQGGIRANIGQSDLAQVSMLVPPIGEQGVIAEALSGADAYVESLEQLIAKKRFLKQGTMQDLLTGKSRLPTFADAMGFQDTEIGPIPATWRVATAGSVGRFRGGTGFPTKFQGDTSGKYPFFKVSDMNNEGNETFMERANNYISESTRSRLGATVFPANTIVFAKVGAAVFLERKKVLTAPSCLDNNMAGYTIFDRNVDSRFVHYFLLNYQLGSLVSTTALPSLNGAVLNGIAIPMPATKTEQSAIAGVFSDMDDEIAALEDKLHKARDIKQGMMQNLLTGKVRLV